MSWITIEEAEKVYGISNRTVYRRIESGDLTTSRRDGEKKVWVDEEAPKEKKVSDLENQRSQKSKTDDIIKIADLERGVKNREVEISRINKSHEKEISRRDTEDSKKDQHHKEEVTRLEKDKDKAHEHISNLLETNHTSQKALAMAAIKDSNLKQISGGGWEYDDSNHQLREGRGSVTKKSKSWHTQVSVFLGCTLVFVSVFLWKEHINKQTLEAKDKTHKAELTAKDSENIEQKQEYEKTITNLNQKNKKESEQKKTDYERRLKESDTRQKEEITRLGLQQENLIQTLVVSHEKNMAKQIDSHKEIREEGRGFQQKIASLESQVLVLSSGNVQLVVSSGNAKI